MGDRNIFRRGRPNYPTEYGCAVRQDRDFGISLGRFTANSDLGQVTYPVDRKSIFVREGGGGERKEEKKQQR